MITITSIEEGIPVPPVAGGGQPNKIIRSMQPGQSFVLKDTKREDVTSWRSYWAKKGLRFDVRKVEGGIRIWCRENKLLAQPSTPPSQSA